MNSETRHRSPVRLLAPIALIVFGIAFLLVIANGGGSGGAGGGSSAAEKQRDLGTPASERKQQRKKERTTTTQAPTGDTYTVKQGDTLAGIAETTGVSVERLQELNPGLDQFSLVAGQKIKLR